MTEITKDQPMRCRLVAKPPRVLFNAVASRWLLAQGAGSVRIMERDGYAFFVPAPNGTGFHLAIVRDGERPTVRVSCSANADVRRLLGGYGAPLALSVHAGLLVVRRTPDV